MIHTHIEKRVFSNHFNGTLMCKSNIILIKILFIPAQKIEISEQIIVFALSFSEFPKGDCCFN